MSSRTMDHRVRPVVEQLEGRDVPSVFVTPAAIPAQSILHSHTPPAHGHGHPGGVITIHVLADDTAAMQLTSSPASSLSESIAIVNSTTGQPGMFEALTPSGTVHGHNGNLEIKIDRGAVKTALKALDANFSQPLLTEVKVSNGTASEVGFLTILPAPVHPAHHHHPHHPATHMT